jgi:hypothetical protein
MVYYSHQGTYSLHALTFGAQKIRHVLLGYKK